MLLVFFLLRVFSSSFPFIIRPQNVNANNNTHHFITYMYYLPPLDLCLFVFSFLLVFFPPCICAELRQRIGRIYGKRLQSMWIMLAIILIHCNQNEIWTPLLQLEMVFEIWKRTQPTLNWKQKKTRKTMANRSNALLGAESSLLIFVVCSFLVSKINKANFRSACFEN